MTSNDSQHTTRPFGYWLRTVERLFTAELAAAFANEGMTRRDWHLLNAVEAPTPPHRPLRGRKLHYLIDREWITGGEGRWVLTEQGRDAKARLTAVVDGVQARITAAVSHEELSTTQRSLEQIAVALGWDENEPLPARRGHRWGHPGGFGHRLHGHRGPHGFERGFGRPHGAGKGHGRFAQAAYERGFDAGFARGGTAS